MIEVRQLAPSYERLCVDRASLRDMPHDGVFLKGCEMMTGENHADERAELHFLAALCDELMRALLIAGVLDRAQLNEIEAAVATRVGSSPRGW
jgi:hypothetical protein